MTRSLILDTITRVAFPFALTFSLYLLFVGHNAPGGGFVGGLTAGIAFVLVYVGGGIERLRAVVGFGYEALLGVGLVLATATGLGSLLLDQPFLSSAILEWKPPVLGEIKLVTVLFFDIGVYLIVVGLTLALLSVLGSRDEPDQHSRRAETERATDGRGDGASRPAGRPTGDRREVTS